jgi:HSP20 family protein
MKHSLVKRLLLAFALAALIGPVVAAETATSENQASESQSTQQGAPPNNATASSGNRNVWEEMRLMQRQMNQMFDQAYARMQSGFGESSAESQSGAPVPESQVSLKEQKHDYVVTADMPGVQRGDIDVSLDGRLLRISAQNQSQEDIKGKHGKVVGEETHAADYQRALTLPGPVDASGMKTQFKDGQLRVSIPKAKS